MSIPETLDRLKTSEKGLSAKEAQRRLKEYGLNTLPETKADSIALIFFKQFQSSLIYLLLGASVIVFAIGEIADGSIILAVLFFNAIVGTIQEGRAQNTLQALRNFVETRATVVRDGEEVVVPDREIVPGDVIILQEGEKVPADARVLLSQNLRADEAALTGESVSVHKNPEVPTLEGGGEDARTMVFKGTHVVAGNGKAIVIGTGISTSIGRIAKEITEIKSEIPLKANIRALSYVVIVAVLALSTTLFLVGTYFGTSAREMFTTVVAITVSLTPEGLPIVMTLVLASGVWRMSKRNALVKKLQAVEALGQARVIAVDKTGTLTKNEMVVQSVYVDGKHFEVSGVGFDPRGVVRLGGVVAKTEAYPELSMLGRIAALSPSARVMYAEEQHEWRVSGDPTEAAVLVLSHKLGFKKDDLEQELPLIAELPFDYKLKYRANLHRIDEHRVLSVVGAPEVVLESSERVWRGGEEQHLLKPERDALEAVFLAMSAKGLRVVALAERRVTKDEVSPDDVKNLVFVGFLGMKDALREGVKEAMHKATSAGIRVVMITGDHRVTAEAVAREAGIYQGGDVLTGKDIDNLSDESLKEKLATTTVFARVTPEHKLRIIKAYKMRGEIVAMTGDGVNDAPSLVAADLGVAMGKIGTEVAKEASDIVLLDDNFGSIVSAVEEGRGIYRSMKRVILYLFSTGVGEMFAIGGAVFAGLPIPILPAQIIWLNFVTDGFLDVSLAMEPKEEGLLSKDFKRPGKYLIDRHMTYRMIFMAAPMALGALYIFTSYYETDITKAWTMSLTTLAAFQWFNAWNCRSESESIFRMNPFSNLYLVGATIGIIGLQILAVYNPLMQKILHTVPLSLSEWVTIIAIASSILVLEEIRKFVSRRFPSIARAML